MAQKDMLVGAYVTLRALQADFLSEYCRMFSMTVRKAVHTISLYAEGKYFLSFLRQKNNKFFYCIFDKVENKLIGAIVIRDAEQYAGQLYSWINEQYWGGGRYQETLALVTQEYFLQTCVQMLTAHVDVANKRSYYALKKNGFADVGIKNGSHGKQYVLVLRKK